MAGRFIITLVIENWYEVSVLEYAQLPPRSSDQKGLLAVIVLISQIFATSFVKIDLHGIIIFL